MAMVLIVSITGTSFAQYDRTANVFPNNNTEWTFNYPAPGKLQTRFEFLLSKGNKMVLELSNITQIDSVANPDSIVSKVWAALAPFMDSLSKPLASLRIDYLFTPVDEKIRIVEYPQRADIFRIKENDITQLKVDQDTLRIKLYTKKHPLLSRPYFIMLILNNITDLTSLGPDELSQGIALLKNDLDQFQKLKRNNRSFSWYYALYNVQTGKKIAPYKGNIGFGRRNEVIPFIPVGVQYIRGAWVPSTGVGVEWKAINGNATRYLRLYWEPLFYFSRDASNKLTTDVNSFASFKYTENTRNAATKNLIFAVNFSIGYLANSQGELFEKNTFKFSLPGFQLKNVLLEPEFVFNKFFKNFSPSLKLSLYFE